MKSSTKVGIIITSIIAFVIVTASGICFFVFVNANRNNTPPHLDESMATPTPGDSQPYNFDYSWMNKSPYVAHAFGGILEDSYTNSYEAFLLNYQLGHRVFEVDFSITDDGQTVAAHDATHWQDNSTIHGKADWVEPSTDQNFTYGNFMSSLWFDKYHPVGLDHLFQILQDYPDVYIVTDTKYYDEANVKKQFSAFVQTADRFDRSLLDRFIVQIYNSEMLDYIMPIYPWKSVIYTLYQAPSWTPESIIDFSKKSGVRFITYWGSALKPELVKKWKDSGIYTAAHTINNLPYANQLRESGVNIIYTDFLIP